MVQRLLVAVVVTVLLGALTLCLQINVGRLSEAASRHKRAAQEQPETFSANDSTVDTTETYETTTEETTTTSTTSTTTICPESSLNVFLTPSNNSISVSWEFDNTCGNLQGFEVSWDNPQRGTAHVPANETEYTILGLEACQEYLVEVVAKGTDGPVKGTNETSTTTEVPPPVTALNVTEANARNLTLSWTAPRTACPLNYTVAYSGTADWGDNPVKNDTILSDDESEMLEDLQPYSDYIICVTATTDAGNSTETCATAETAEDAPSAPTNVSVVPASSRSLYASWSEPAQINGELGDYTVSWTDDGGLTGSKTTPNTSLTIDELVACVTYSVNVTASTGGGQATSGAVLGLTKEEAPPEVTNFTNTSCDAHNVTLTWTEPFTACIITEYIISYNWTVMWGEYDTGNNAAFISDGNATEFTVTGLVPYSSYMMCIVAVIGNTNGTEACLEQPVLTMEDVPSKPTNLTADSSTATSILVSWDEPKEHNGILLQYNVTWSDGGTVIEGECTNDTRYTIKGLISCVNYTVTVTASTSVGEGDGRFTSTTTDDAIPPPVDGVTASEVEAETLTLSWSPPNTTCDVIIYTVTYNGTAQWGIHNTHNNSTTEVTETLSLDGLTPFSNYTVCVAANTTAGQGDPTCTEAQTKEKEPSEPRSLQLTPTNNNISVHWTKPEQENGVLGDYSISWHGEHVVNGSNNVTDLKYEIGNLPACVDISVKVAASTSVGFGQESEDNDRTLDEVPPPVDNVDVWDVNARNLTLTWFPPDTYCDVTNYTVTFNGTAQWGTNKTISGSKTEETETLSLDGLTPFSKYTVCVAASTTAGLGDTSCTEASTEEDAPSVPTSLEVSELKAKKASITWGLPSDLNGVLKNYTVSVFDTVNSTVAGPVTIPADDQRSCSFSDLEPETNYEFRVEACTNAGCSLDSTDFITSKSWTALIVGLTVGLVVVAALVALIFVKKDAMRSALKKTKPKILHASESKRAKHYRPSIFVKVEDAAVHKHHIPQCIEALKSNEGASLRSEFEQMDKKSPTGTMNIATSPANYHKNRYINILPFDDNIVYLDSRTENYVNASLVQDYEGKDLFIAAQGPMDATVAQFWQLVWEQDVENIVMLANCFESGKEKCAEYWPQLRQTRVLSQQFKIVNCSEEDNESFVVRTLEIRYKQSSRFVKQFHYTAWPDFGVPDDGASILDLMSAVKKSFVSSATTEADRHILVHCSAGVGRTGTFIGVWNLCHRDLNEHADKINVMKEVLNMRERRVMMVQTPDQYLMLYKCFLEYYKDVTRWPLPENDAPEGSVYQLQTSDENGNTSQPEPIYENISLQQRESIYENANPRQQESVYGNRSPRQQESVYGNKSPRQQGLAYKNTSTPQEAWHRNENPRLLDSSFRQGSPQQEGGIYENDEPAQPLRPQGGSDPTGARRQVFHH